MTELTAAALVAAFAAVFTTIVQAILGRRKLSAEATSILTTAAAGLVDKLYKQIEELEKDSKEYRRIITSQKKYIRDISVYITLIVAHLNTQQITGLPDPPEYHDPEDIP